MLKSIEDFDFNKNLEYFASHQHIIDGARIVVSGASGFIGSWICELLFQISREYQVKIEVVLLTRNEKLLREKMHNIPKSFFVIEHDISRSATQIGFVSHIIHSAMPTVATSGGNIQRASLEGAKNLLKSVSLSQNKPVFVNLSSGAVYGFNKLSQGPIELSAKTARLTVVSDTLNPYTEAKIETEEFINNQTSLGSIIGCNPRLFAFFGPLLPLNQKYAIGNFMQNVVRSENIKLKTKGESVRSYMHVSTLASQLIYLLCNPIQGHSHIGSTFSKPLKWWAQYLSEIFDTGPVKYDEQAEIPSYYAPVADNRILAFDCTESERENEFRHWYNWQKDQETK